MPLSNGYGGLQPSTVICGGQTQMAAEDRSHLSPPQPFEKFDRFRMGQIKIESIMGIVQADGLS